VIHVPSCPISKTHDLGPCATSRSYSRFLFLVSSKRRQIRNTITHEFGFQSWNGDRNFVAASSIMKIRHITMHSVENIIQATERLERKRGNPLHVTSLTAFFISSCGNFIICLVIVPHASSSSHSCPASPTSNSYQLHATATSLLKSLHFTASGDIHFCLALQTIE
jgi:hypothetical protein